MTKMTKKCYLIYSEWGNIYNTGQYKFYRAFYTKFGAQLFRWVNILFNRRIACISEIRMFSNLSS